jgi:magnesium-transporting ATPase (P-type)
VGTGDHTAIGAINTLVKNEEEKPSSLQVQLEIFGRAISIITLVIGIAAFLLAFFYTKSGWAEAFRASVAIAVAIIPEGLPAVVTITMALGVSAMAARKASVRNMATGENPGRKCVSHGIRQCWGTENGEAWSKSIRNGGGPHTEMSSDRILSTSLPYKA